MLRPVPELPMLRADPVPRAHLGRLHGARQNPLQLERRLIRIERHRPPQLQRDRPSQPPQRLRPILQLRPTLAGLPDHPRRLVHQPHRRIPTVAMLPARPRHAEAVEAALRLQLRIRQRQPVVLRHTCHDGASHFRSTTAATT